MQWKPSVNCAHKSELPLKLPHAIEICPWLVVPADTEEDNEANTIGDGAAQQNRNYRRLQQEVVTCWNSALEWLRA